MRRRSPELSSTIGRASTYRFVPMLLVAAGVLARLVVAARGHNFDLESYWIVGGIVDAGGDVYEETTRYNYGPIWLVVVGAAYRLTELLGGGFEFFRYTITTALTGVDLVICFILWKTFGRTAALLFFLNPIAILITGYHSQFDNIALLLGLAAMLAYSSARARRSSGAEVLALALLGLSLMTKHILFALPVWLALKSKVVREKAVAIAVPYAVFFAGFLPFVAQWDAILDNVFFYQSFDNAPFLRALGTGLLPERVLASDVFTYGFFAVVLVVMGLVVRERDAVESLLVYSLCVVAFSPAIANQYLAIPVAAIAVFPNIVFAVYTVAVTAFLSVDPDGLHLVASLQDDVLAERTRAYGLLVVLLALGLVRLIVGPRINEWVRHAWSSTWSWIRREARFQTGSARPPRSRQR